MAATEEQQFVQLLDNMMALDNNVRADAEKAYNTISFDHKIIFLVKCMRNQVVVLASKTLALVMLRRLISTSVEENWSGLDDQIKTTLKAELLNAVQQEAEQSIRKKITDVIAELARFLIGNTLYNFILDIENFATKM